jgi:GAG-pre-integrase domain
MEIVNSAGRVILVKHCLLVPGLGMNLFSVSADKGKGIEAIFFDNMVQFYRDGNLEMEGQRASEKLYYLDAMVKIQQDTSCAAVCRSQPLGIWHERYGHVNNKTILSMVNKGSVNGIQLDHQNYASVVLKEKCTSLPSKLADERQSKSVSEFILMLMVRCRRCHPANLAILPHLKMTAAAGAKFSS